MKQWLLAGVCGGLALLGKYPAVLLPGTVFIALLFSREGRRELTPSGPWLATAVAALLFVPVVLWNYQHDWTKTPCPEQGKIPGGCYQFVTGIDGMGLQFGNNEIRVGHVQFPAWQVYQQCETEITEKDTGSSGCSQ